MIMKKRGKNITFNEDYFEKIDSEDKSYFLGFIAADGCIIHRSKNCKVLIININKKDIDILNKFKTIINYSGEINICMNRFNMCVMYFHSFKLVNDLSKYNIISNKTKVLKFPELPKNLIHHFMRGYFDGDGCVSIHIDKRRDNEKDKGTGNINIVSGSLDFIKKYVDIFVEIAKVKRNKIRDRKTNGKYFVIDWGGLTDVENIYYFLYKDANIYLERKKKKFDEVIKINSLKSKYRKK